MEEVFKFLRELSADNNREWFNANKSVYMGVKQKIDDFAQEIINAVGQIDSRALMLGVKDCTYRIYRDVRFSADKSPYKTHFGIFVNPPYGKKCNTCGYYVHIEPGNCIICGGTIGLESKVLAAIRRSIYDNIDEYRSIVESEEFRKCYPYLGDNFLKTVPKGFSKDWEYVDYVRPRDFMCYAKVPDSFFIKSDCIGRLMPYLVQAKRFNDFMNYTIEDYI